MARLPRTVVLGHPHHITQRGNRRQPTFSGDEDYETYLRVMAASCAEHGVVIWAWCLMPNHVHLVAVPEMAEGLASTVGRWAIRHSSPDWRAAWAASIGSHPSPSPNGSDKVCVTGTSR